MIPFKLLIGLALVQQGAESIDRLPRWTLTRAGTLGLPGSGAEFNEILDVAAFPDGTVLVVDKTPPFLRQVTATGRVQIQSGQSGEGPGEFRMFRRIGMRSDSLWVFDPVLQRVTFLNRGQALLTTVRFRAEITPPLVGADPAAFLDDGTVLLVATAASSGLANPLGVGAVRSIPVLLATRSGKVIKKIAEINLQVAHMAARVLREGQPGQVFLQQPFSDDPLVEVAHDGSSVVLVERRAESRWMSEALVVTKLTGRGDTIFTRRYRYSPLPLDNAVFEQEVAKILQRFRQGKYDLREDDIRERMYRPDFRPVVEEARIASDGLLWLRRETSYGEKTVHYVVLGVKGEPVGEVVLPREERVLDATASMLWVSSASDDGTPILVSYRIHRP